MEMRLWCMDHHECSAIHSHFMFFFLTFCASLVMQKNHKMNENSVFFIPKMGYFFFPSSLFKMNQDLTWFWFIQLALRSNIEFHSLLLQTWFKSVEISHKNWEDFQEKYFWTKFLYFKLIQYSEDDKDFFIPNNLIQIEFVKLNWNCLIHWRFTKLFVHSTKRFFLLE